MEDENYISYRENQRIKQKFRTQATKRGTSINLKTEERDKMENLKTDEERVSKLELIAMRKPLDLFRVCMNRKGSRIQVFIPSIAPQYRI